MNNDDVTAFFALIVGIFFLGFLAGSKLSAPKEPSRESIVLVNVVKTNDYLGNTYYLAFPKE